MRQTLARLLGLALLLMLGASFAAAQQVITTQPLIGSTATDSQHTDDSGEAVTRGPDILVVGDALGGGLGAGMIRRAEADGDVTITLRFNEESGIARPEVYDWTATLPKILEGKSYDAAVVLLGANDRQMMRSGNLRFAFNSPEWIAAYRERVDRVLDVLTGAVPRVYWVSLPPMADSDYQAAMDIILAIQKDSAERKGATFVDIRQAFLTKDGRYTDSGPDDTGDIRKLRSSDGVTFFKQGNNRMAQLVLEVIRKGITLAPPVARPAPDKAGPETAPRLAARPESPLFGQAGPEGDLAPFHADDPGVAAIASIMAAGSYGAGLAVLRDLSPPGSAAERLFVAGDSLPAPKGRADDFAVPAGN